MANTRTSTTTKVKPIVLDPDNEFEAILIAMAEMHRTKSALYGSEEDPLTNFYDASKVMGISPTRVAHAFGAKHEARLMKWEREGEPTDEVGAAAMDDCMIDRCVYAVIVKMLYDRGPIENGWVEPQ